MRVEPAGGRRLIDGEIHRARRAGMNQCLRATIDVTGNLEPCQWTVLASARACF